MIRPFLTLALVGAVAACDATGASEAADAADPPADAPAASARDATSPTPAPSVRTPGLDLSDIVVAEPVGGERAALFMTIRSLADSADALLGLDVDGAAHASIHRTVEEEGIMSMRPVDSLPLAPGDSLQLRPGGLHGMLEGLTTGWSAGDTVLIRLRFRTSGEVEVPALVVPYTELDRRFPRGASHR